MGIKLHLKVNRLHVWVNVPPTHNRKKGVIVFYNSYETEHDSHNVTVLLILLSI